MALKTVIKFVFIFFIVQISLAQSDYKDIYHIEFVKKDSFELKKYSRNYNKEKLKFFFRNKHSLKSPIFIYNIKESTKTIMNATDIKTVDFTDPWEAYWIYHKAKDKPQLYLYEYDEETNCYYKYPVTIEFPPPPPPPDTSRGHGIEIIEN